MIRRGNMLLIQMNIHHPVSTDLGFYTCELYAAGKPQRRIQSLQIKAAPRLKESRSYVKVQNTDTPFHEIKSPPTSTKTGFATHGIRLILLTFGIVSPFVVLISLLLWKKVCFDRSEETGNSQTKRDLLKENLPDEL